MEGVSGGLLISVFAAYGLSAAMAGYLILRGGAPEREWAAVFLGVLMVEQGLMSELPHTFSSLAEMRVVLRLMSLCDIMLLAGTILVAARANRVWPAICCGFVTVQFLISARCGWTLAQPHFDPLLIRKATWAAQLVSAYCGCLIELGAAKARGRLALGAKAQGNSVVQRLLGWTFARLGEKIPR